MKGVFTYQIWHGVFAVLFLVLAGLFISHYVKFFSGEFLGVESKVWFWVAVTTPVLHQTYVAAIWRLELFKKTFSSLCGVSQAFTLYAIGFSLLFVCRLIFIIALALSDKGTLSLEPIFAYSLAAFITPPVVYLFYSVRKYFTLRRAYGIDHFEKNYHAPFEKKGIFRYTNNGMYVYGLMVLYLPGLILLSQAALIVALFNHLYIWVHYYCTERPDMKIIYGRSE